MSVKTAMNAGDPGPSSGGLGGAKPGAVRDLMACLLFLLPLLYLTRQALFALSTTIIGGRFTFGFLWGWNIITLGLLKKHAIVLVSAALDYPTGGSLTLVGWTYIFGLVILRALGIGFIFGANLLLYLHLLAACFFAYRLALRLTARWGASAVAGLSYGLSPYALSLIWNGQYAELGHGLLPLVLLLMMDLAETRRMKPAIFLGIVLGIAPSTSPYMGVFCALLAAIGGIALLVRPKIDNRRRLFLRLIAAAIISLAVATPFLAYYQASRVPGMTRLQVPAEFGQLPFRNVPFVGENQNAVASCWLWPCKSDLSEASGKIWSVRHIHYLGWLNFALAAAVILWRKREAPNVIADSPPVFGVWFFLVTGCVFLVFAQGFYLIFAPGRDNIFGWIVTLPLYWLSRAWLPVSHFAMPYRAAVGVTLCVSMLGAIGLGRIVGRMSRCRAGAVMTLCGLGIFLETLFVSPVPQPLPQFKIDVPQVYRDLAGMRDCDGVLEIPYETAREAEKPTGANLWYLLYQLYHGHPISNYDKYLGVRGQAIPSTEFIGRLERAIYAAESPPAPSTDETLPLPHFKYLVVHEKLLDRQAIEAVRRFLATTMVLVADYPQDGIRLYSSPAHENADSFAHHVPSPRGSQMECLLLKPSEIKEIITPMRNSVAVFRPESAVHVGGVNP